MLKRPFVTSKSFVTSANGLSAWGGGPGGGPAGVAGAAAGVVAGAVAAGAGVGVGSGVVFRLRRCLFDLSFERAALSAKVLSGAIPVVTISVAKTAAAYLIGA